MDSKDLAEKVALHYLGTPYRWGGDDFSAFDCSGFVIEVLKSVGLLPRQGDWTAATLSTMFLEVETANRGCLVFWQNRRQRIIHVEYCLDSQHSIGASGGGSRTLNLQDAVRQNAYIKIRPMQSRYGIAKYVDPWATPEVTV